MLKHSETGQPTARPLLCQGLVPGSQVTSWHLGRSCTSQQWGSQVAGPTFLPHAAQHSPQMGISVVSERLFARPPRKGTAAPRDDRHQKAVTWDGRHAGGPPPAAPVSRPLPSPSSSAVMPGPPHSPSSPHITENTFH